MWHLINPGWCFLRKREKHRDKHVAPILLFSVLVLTICTIFTAANAIREDEQKAWPSARVSSWLAIVPDSTKPLRNEDSSGKDQFSSNWWWSYFLERDLPGRDDTRRKNRAFVARESERFKIAKAIRNVSASVANCRSKDGDYIDL